MKHVLFTTNTFSVVQFRKPVGNANSLDMTELDNELVKFFAFGS